MGGGFISVVEMTVDEFLNGDREKVAGSQADPNVIQVHNQKC